jgi:hypothetical protein
MADVRPIIIKLTVTPEIAGNIENLRVRLGAADMSQVISYALAAIDTIVGALEQGGQVIIRDAQGQEREIILRSPPQPMWVPPEWEKE